MAAALTAFMKKVLKIIGVLILAVVLIFAAIFLYVFRPQSIDVGLLPQEFQYCDKPIWGADGKYVEIRSWIKSNNEGWRLSYASYNPKLSYSYPSYKIGLLESGVVVSYKTDYGYPQFYKSINHGLSMVCTNGS